MTQQEKQLECLRICGKSNERDMHRMAPEMCPILLDQWRSGQDSWQKKSQFKSITPPVASTPIQSQEVT